MPSLLDEEITRCAKKLLIRVLEEEAALIAKERADIDLSAHHNVHLPDGYWQQRHAASAQASRLRKLIDGEDA
jgi:hypothetical protein